MDSGSGGVTGFLLPDLHANLAAVTNSAETAIASATRYDPYGLTVATYDSGGAFPTPWKFQGRLDVSANPADPLYEFSARFYQPATATFSQLDTYAGSVADPLSLNRYLYAAANPWTLIDPSGHRYLIYAGEGTQLPAPDPGKLVAIGDTSDPSKIGDVLAIVAFTIAAPLVFEFGASYISSMTVAAMGNAAAIRAAAQAGGATGALTELCRRHCESVGGILEGFSGAPACSLATCVRAPAVPSGPRSGSGSALARAGLSAEASVAERIGVARNAGASRVTVPGSGPGGFRVPDFNPSLTIASRGTVVEVKATAELFATPQLRDLVSFARSQGVPLEIFTNASLPTSGELFNWIRSGQVIISPL